MAHADSSSDRAAFICAFFALAMFTACGIRAFHRNQRSCGGHQLLVISEKSVELGSIWSRSDFQWSFQAENVGYSYLQVSRFASTRTVDAKMRPMTVAPDTTVQCDVVFDFDRDLAVDMRTNAAKVSLEVSPVIPGSPRQVGWVLTADVRVPWIAKPPSLDKSVVVGDDIPELTSDIQCDPDISHLTANCDPGFGLVALDVLSAKPLMYRLKAKPCTQIKLGRSDYRIALQGVDKHGVKVPPREISVNLTCTGPVSPIPSSLHLGIIKREKVKSADLVLKSQTEMEFVVVSVRSDHESVLSIKSPNEFSLQKYSTRQNILLNIQPRMDGTQDTKIFFTVRSKDEHQSVIEMPLTFYCDGR